MINDKYTYIYIAVYGIGIKDHFHKNKILNRFQFFFKLNKTNLNYYIIILQVYLRYSYSRYNLILFQKYIQMIGKS